MTLNHGRRHVLPALAFLAWANLAPAQTPLAYWDVPRKGANLFDGRETAERLQAAAREGISFVRMAPNKWPTAARDFLLGDADDYLGLVPADLERLRATLGEADAAGLKVVLTTLSLPGARWAQQNGGERDRRLWTDERWPAQAEAFWRDLASALRGTPGLAAYNLLNEPYPEAAAPGFERLGPARWDESVRGGPADLNRFNARLVRAIRAVDSATPILLDVGLFADPGRFESLLPVDHPAVLYAFHMYEPFTYTNRKRNGGRFAYPGPVPDDAPGGRKRLWDAVALEEYLEPVRSWQGRHGVPSSRIMAAEFGCHRLSRGADRYLDDLLRIFDRRGWHWAFYAFREDTWDGMDYEKGPRPLFPILRRALAGSPRPSAPP